MSCECYSGNQGANRTTPATDNYIINTGKVLAGLMIAGYLVSSFISTPDPRSAEGDLVPTLTHTSTKLVGDKQ